MPIDVSRAPTAASPLWIIALFIALSEATAGVASITTSGSARLIFAIFAVAFPVAVFVVFTWLLVEHTAKLYPPNQYSEAITPGAFSEGVNAHRGFAISFGTSEVFGKAVAAAVSKPLDDNGFDNLSVEEQREQVYRAFEDTVRERSVVVDVSAIVPGMEPRFMPIDDHTMVSDLLDGIYFMLAPAVKPYEYSKTWLLRNRETGELYDSMGTAWAREHLESRDERRLVRVGIKPRAHLDVVRVNDTATSVRQRTEGRRRVVRMPDKPEAGSAE